MHPLFRSLRFLLLALAIWLALTTILSGVVVGLSDLGWSRTLIWLLPAMMLLFFMSASSWYLCRQEPLRLARIWRVILVQTLSASLVTTVWLGALILYGGLLSRISSDHSWDAAAGQIGILLGFAAWASYLALAMFHYLLISLEQRAETERRLLEENLSGAQSELRALRNTIHPHFLFNTLTALSVLSREDPEQTRLTLLHLSDFLRHSLRYQKENRVPFAEEIEHIRNYLAVEALRLGRRLKYEIRLEPGVAQWKLLSLTLLPLVENAIKHGIQSRLEGGTVLIEGWRHKDLLRIRVSNPLPPGDGPKPVGEGLGISTLQRRLQIVYQGRAWLETRSEGEHFVSELSFPEKEAEEASDVR